MSDTTKKFAFLLGREHEICLAELKSVLCRFCFSFSIFRISGNIVFANMENVSTDDLKQIMQALGGTIKIFEIVSPLKNNLENQIAELIIKEKKNTEGKINFGISCFDRKFTRQQINSFALGAKKKLKGKVSLRFVEAKDNLELSSIQSLKNDLDGKGLEFGIFDEEIGIMIALNNPEEWNKRDYGKPASDKYSGMVPPKLARMMVNLALGQIENSKLETRNSKQTCLPTGKIQNSNDKNSNFSDFGFRTSDLKQSVVIDCFCGSGNILLEAMMLGYDVIGSDISSKAVSDSRINIEWLLGEMTKSKLQITNKNQNLKSKLFVADASSDSLTENWKLETGNCDNVVVVSEPYLGEPKKFKPSYNSVRGEYDKIKSLYIKFLTNILSPVPRPSSLVLCLVFPLVETEDQGQFSLYNDSVDEIKELGYTQVRPTMIYGREYQVVKREIVLLNLT